MSYELAKWLFPKLRPDMAVKRMNTIVLVTLFTTGTVGIAVAIILVRYQQQGR